MLMTVFLLICKVKEIPPSHFFLQRRVLSMDWTSLDACNVRQLGGWPHFRRHCASISLLMFLGVTTDLLLCDVFLHQKVPFLHTPAPRSELSHHVCEYAVHFPSEFQFQQNRQLRLVIESLPNTPHNRL